MVVVLCIVSIVAIENGRGAECLKDRLGIGDSDVGAVVGVV